MAHGTDKSSKEQEPRLSQGEKELETAGVLPTVSVTPANGTNLVLGFLAPQPVSCVWNQTGDEGDNGGCIRFWL